MTDDSDSHRLERWVHRTLLAGVVVSGLLLAVGLALVVSQGQVRPAGRPPSVGALMGGAIQGDGAAWLHLGLLALMATPVLRVAALALGWGLERAWRFSAIAMVVLGLLALSLVIGVG